jgi:PhnB protein
MNVSAPIPHLVVDDGEAAVAFYEKAFGATLQGKHQAEDGKRLMHAHLALGNGDLFLMDDFPEYDACGSSRSPVRIGGTSCVIHLNVPDADAAWERAVEAGAEVVLALENQFWGMRYGQVKDPFGHVWSIGGPVK